MPITASSRLGHSAHTGSCVNAMSPVEPTTHVGHSAGPVFGPRLLALHFVAGRLVCEPASIHTSHRSIDLPPKSMRAGTLEIISVRTVRVHPTKYCVSDMGHRGFPPPQTFTSFALGWRPECPLIGPEPLTASDPLQRFGRWPTRGNDPSRSSHGICIPCDLYRGDGHMVRMRGAFPPGVVGTGVQAQA